LVATALVALTTAAVLTVYLTLQSQHLIFGYLIPITVVAVRYGSAPAVATVIASDLCAAYFLYPPDFSFSIADPLQVAELSFFSLLVLPVSQFIGGFADDERLAKRAVLYRKAWARIQRARKGCSAAATSSGNSSWAASLPRARRTLSTPSISAKASISASERRGVWVP